MHSIMFVVSKMTVKSYVLEYQLSAIYEPHEYVNFVRDHSFSVSLQLMYTAVFYLHMSDF